MITIDIVKARNMWRDRIRAARLEKLAALDIAFMRAVELQDTEEQKRIANEKQWLRELTNAPEIEAAQTVNELKAFFPL